MKLITRVIIVKNNIKELKIILIIIINSLIIKIMLKKEKKIMIYVLMKMN